MCDSGVTILCGLDFHHFFLFLGRHLLSHGNVPIGQLLYLILGAAELTRFGQATGTLQRALGDLPEDLPQLGDWLARLHPTLQNPVRLRIEGERSALPGPALTPYLVGLLVLLGMLGTFLGMVVTLNGTVTALESTTDLQAIRSSLAAPVKGLGLAFGTSVAGVAASAMLGALALGSPACADDPVGDQLDQIEAQIALRRWGEPEDVADVVTFLASDAARYVTGVTIPIDGGMATTLDLYGGAV